MSGDFYKGMNGPGAAIAFNLAAPTGVNFSTAISRTLSVTFRGPVVSVATAWTMSGITPSAMVATLIPDGSEFPQAGLMRIELNAAAALTRSGSSVSAQGSVELNAAAALTRSGSSVSAQGSVGSGVNGSFEVTREGSSVSAQGSLSILGIVLTVRAGSSVSVTGSIPAIPAVTRDLTPADKVQRNVEFEWLTRDLTPAEFVNRELAPASRVTRDLEAA